MPVVWTVDPRSQGSGRVELPAPGRRSAGDGSGVGRIPRPLDPTPPFWRSRLARTAAPGVGGNRRRRGAHSTKATGWLRALREGRPAATRPALLGDPLDGGAVLLGQVVNPRRQSVVLGRARRGLGQLAQGSAPARLYRLRARWFVASAQRSPPHTEMMYLSVQRETTLRGVQDALSPAASALWVTRLGPLRAWTTIPVPTGKLERRRRGSTQRTR